MGVRREAKWRCKSIFVFDPLAPHAAAFSYVVAVVIFAVNISSVTHFAIALFTFSLMVIAIKPGKGGNASFLGFKIQISLRRLFPVKISHSIP